MRSLVTEFLTLYESPKFREYYSWLRPQSAACMPVASRLSVVASRTKTSREQMMKVDEACLGWGAIFLPCKRLLSYRIRGNKSINRGDGGM